METDPSYTCCFSARLPSEGGRYISTWWAQKVVFPVQQVAKFVANLVAVKSFLKKGVFFGKYSCCACYQTWLIMGVHLVVHFHSLFRWRRGASQSLVFFLGDDMSRLDIVLMIP